MTDTPQPSSPKALLPDEEPQILAVRRRPGGWTVSRRELLAGAAGAVGAVATSGCDPAKPAGPDPTAPRRSGVPMPGTPAGVSVNIPCSDRPAHDANITLIGGSPDGRCLATVDETGVIKIWGADPPAQIRKLETIAKGAKYLAFDSQCHHLAVAEGKLNLVVCNLQTSTANSILLAEGEMIKALLWVKLPEEADPAVVVLLANGRLWRIHQGQTESPTQLWNIAPDVTSIAATRDAETLAVAHASGVIELRQLATPQEPLEIAVYPGGNVQTLAFNHGGDLLAIGSEDGAVRIYSVTDQTLLQILRDGSVPVTELAFDTTATYLAVSHADKSCRRWPVQRALLDPGPRLMVRTGSGAAWSRSGNLLMVDADGEVSMWSEQQLDSTTRILGRLQELTGLVVPGDDHDSWLLTTRDGTLTRWSSELAAAPQDCGKIPTEATALACDPASHTVFVGSPIHPVTAIQLPAGEDPFTFGDEGAASRRLVVAPNGDRITGINAAGLLQSWIWPGGHLEAAWIDAPVSTVTLAFSPDGRFLAACGTDQRIVIWSCATRHVVTTWQLPESDVTALCFDPEGHFLLVAEQRAITIWNTLEGRRAGTLETPDRVVSLSISPSGQTVVGVTEQGTIRSWIQRRVQVEKTYTWATSGVQLAALSPVGDSLFIASGKSAAVWKFQDDSAGCLIDFDINYNDVRGYEYEAEFAGRMVTYRVVYMETKTVETTLSRREIAGKMARPAPPPSPVSQPPTTYNTPTYTTYSSHYWRPN